MIQVRSLYKSFEREIISDFSIEFAAGKTSVILGPSGCGKTTLFNILSGLDRDYEGEISIDSRVSYIFQEDRLIPWLTARENLELVQGREKKETDSLENILKKFHLSHRKDSMARDLSGGEKQRLSIARAFLHRSSTLLMDEALRSMDLSLKLNIIKEINSALEEYKKTMVVISHDIREALLLADTIYVLDRDPMRIAEIIHIQVPKGKRNLYDEEILRLEKKLYTLLLK